MMRIEQKCKQLYTKTILDDYGTALEICAVNESDDNNFIDLHLLIPYQLNAEIYCEKGYSFDEKIRKINDLMDGLYYAARWIYKRKNQPLNNEKMVDGPAELFDQSDYENAKSVDSILYTEKILEGFKPRDISVSLRSRIQDMMQMIFIDGKAYNKSSFPIQFIYMVMGIRKMDRFNMNGLLDEQRCRIFNEFSENKKLNLYLDFHTGIKTEFDKQIKEWWKENCKNFTI